MEKKRKWTKAETKEHYGKLRQHAENGGLLALTVYQPMAYWLMLPFEHEMAKRVENRKWMMPPWLAGKRIVIHAGKSRERLRTWDESRYPLKFGAGIGTVMMFDCFRKLTTGDPFTGWEKPLPERYEWMMKHRHSEGPCCWVAGKPDLWAKEEPRPGAQGLWIWD